MLAVRFIISFIRNIIIIINIISIIRRTSSYSRAHYNVSCVSPWNRNTTGRASHTAVSILLVQARACALHCCQIAWFPSIPSYILLFSFLKTFYWLIISLIYNQFAIMNLTQSGIPICICIPICRIVLDEAAASFCVEHQLMSWAFPLNAACTVGVCIASFTLTRLQSPRLFYRSPSFVQSFIG